MGKFALSYALHTAQHLSEVCNHSYQITSHLLDVQAIYDCLSGSFLQGKSFGKHIHLYLLCNARNGLKEVSCKSHKGEDGELSPCRFCPGFFMPCSKK